MSRLAQVTRVESGIEPAQFSTLELTFPTAGKIRDGAMNASPLEPAVNADWTIVKAQSQPFSAESHRPREGKKGRAYKAKEVVSPHLRPPWPLGMSSSVSPPAICSNG